MKSSQFASKILEDRREENKINLENRIKEIYSKFPVIDNIDRKIKSLGFDAIQRAFRDLDTAENENEIMDLSKKKKEILRANGYPIDYLEMHYHCDKCKDTGYVNGKICSCKKQLIIQENYSQSKLQKLLLRENFQKFNINLFSKNKYGNYPISPYENMDFIVKEIRRYVDNFDKDSENLYIYGDVGRGKTFLINCLAKEILDRNYSVIYFTASKLFQFLNDYLYAFSERKEMLFDEYNLILTADLLIIDDLGVEASRESDKSNLFDVLNTRLNDNKPIVFSSNFDEDYIREVYGSRIFSRIIGSSETYEIFGEDLRLR